MADVLAYKCPSCAAPIAFDPATQKMRCASCGTQMDLEAFQAYDAALKRSETDAQAQGAPDWYFQTQARWQDDGYLSASICQSCGGELVMEGTTVATECPYCGNAAVVPEQVTDMLRPDLIIPFKLDKNAAKEALKKFYKGKYLLPKFFKEDNRIDKITGMYVPFWLYDCDSSSTALYNATRVQTWRSGDTEYTKTDHFLLTRSGTMNFEKIPADGSLKMDDTMMEAIEPFGYGDITPFSMAYLSGYLADKYDVDAEANLPRINERIRHSVDQALRRTASGYATLSTQSLNVDIHKGRVHYALMPVWMLNTRWGEDMYGFIMNGQTGKLIGELPIDWKKGWKIGGLIFAIAAAVLIGLGFAVAPAEETMFVVGGASLLGILVGGLSFIPFLFSRKKREKKREEERRKKGLPPTGPAVGKGA